MFGMYGANDKNIKNVTSEGAETAIRENADIIILDVRTRMEYQFGHIPGALLMPVNEIPARMAELEDKKEKPILVYCASGSRSPMAARFLSQNGFTNIYHLATGISMWRGKIQR